MLEKRRDKFKTALVVLIGSVCLVWGVVDYQRGKSNYIRLNERTEFMRSVYETFQATTFDRISRESVVKMLHDFAAENELKTIPDEKLPPKLEFVLPFLPEEAMLK